jgi:RNA polymerase sigma-70 factor (ECF subfamily)
MHRRAPRSGTGVDRLGWAEAANICHREATRVLRHAADADDAAQEALLRAWRNRGRCRSADPEPWLRAIARNEALRLHARRDAQTVPILDGDEAVDHLTMERLIERADVNTALAGLPVHEKAALTARYVLDLTQPAAAAAIGIPEGTMKVRLHRARARIREKLGTEQ